MHRYDIRRWAFFLGDEPQAWAKGFDDSGWRRLTAPHDWSVEQPFAEHHSSGTGYLPGGIGWYRAHIPLAELGELAGRHARLRFEGVYKNAQVWVNGYHLGGRPNGWVEFSFDLTEILSYLTGEEVVVAVRVEHTDISDSRWYNGTGINRHVFLELHQPVRVAEYGTVFETLAASADEASVRIAQTLCNDTAEAVTVHVQHELRSLSGGAVHTFVGKAEVPAGESASAQVTGRVPQPDLWSDTRPNLYRLTTTLSWAEKGEVRRAQYEETVGVRTFRFDPDHGFFINGEARKLKGVCLHEDAGVFGTAVPAAVWLRRLLALKRMGCNGIRMAHNPHAPELYRLCDALGFFVIDEAFDEWENPKNKWWQGHNVYPPRHQGYAKDFPAWHQRDLENMVEAHRNHPSIIAWSIGNEIDYPNDPYASAMFEAMTGNNDANKSARQRAYDPDRPDARRLATLSRKLAAIVRAKDATRPVTVGSAFPELSRHTGFLEPLDLVGYNYKEHLYPEDHARFPAQPIVGSENGHSHANWRAAADNPYISGQFLWTGIDYLGETHGWPYHGSGAGLLNVAGFEKPAFHLRASWWSDEPVAYIATRLREEQRHIWSLPVSRNWDGIAAGTHEVLCLSNGVPRLTANGAEITLTRDEQDGCWVATGPTDAPLVLETLRDGEVVACDTFGPSGDAIRLDAVVWQPPPGLIPRLAAAGLDHEGVVQIECTLRDPAGNCARNDLPITATIEGGSLLGLENGNLADNTPYTEPCRNTHEGRLIAFVRKDDAARVKLTAPGLPEVVLEL